MSLLEKLYLSISNVCNLSWMTTLDDYTRVVIVHTTYSLCFIILATVEFTHSFRRGVGYYNEMNKVGYVLFT